MEKEKVLNRLLGIKEFYVDFGSWHIEARDQEHAFEKAKKMLEMESPEIIDVGEI